MPACLRSVRSFSANVIRLPSLLWYTQYRKLRFPLQAYEHDIPVFLATLRSNLDFHAKRGACFAPRRSDQSRLTVRRGGEANDGISICTFVEP